MTTQTLTSKNVLVFAGLDPSGGAGIQADIEAIISMGCHPLPILTANTVQDTHSVKRFISSDPLFIVEQARTLLDDIHIDAIKLGMLASVPIIQAIHSLLIDYPDIPVIFDPVLTAGQGADLAETGVIESIQNLLLPQTLLLTPNTKEAYALAGHADSLDACAEVLQDYGCEYVLITGTHANTIDVEHRLYHQHRLLDTFKFERLPHEYHGSGCTLASAIASLIAQDGTPANAVDEALGYTYLTLKHAKQIGKGQFIPDRLFWTRNQT